MQDAAGSLPQPPAYPSQARAMAAYTRSMLEPLVDALERSHAHVAELERENGALAERLAGLERVRDAAIAYAHEVEARLGTSTRPPELAPDPFPSTPNVGPARYWRRRVPSWRRWLGRVILGR